MMMNKVQTAVSILFREKPFYAYFFLNSRIVYDNPTIKTAAVSATPNGMVFYFDNQFIDTLAATEVVAIIEHEIMHCLFEHIFVQDKKSSHHNRNIAMDCAINQLIEGLPSIAVTLQSLEKIVEKKLKEKESWVYYLDQIEEFAKNNPDKCLPYLPMDSHEWGEGKEMTEGQKAETRAQIQNAIDKAVSSSKGNLPQNIIETLGAFKQEPKLSWKTILSNFVSRSRSVTRIPTRTRRNRRFGLTTAGYKIKKELTLGVCVDSSGSVSDEDYVLFMNEVTRISKLCSKVYLIDADCTVQNVTVLKKKAPEFTRFGRGGTAYGPALEECVKLKVDAICYFGDMDSSDTPKNPNIPVLWVAVGLQAPPSSFGNVVRLNGTT